MADAAKPGGPSIYSRYPEYYKAYAKRPKERKRRAARSRARRKMIRLGRVQLGDNRDVHHRDGNPLNEHPSNISIAPRAKNRGPLRLAVIRRRQRRRAARKE